jgi:hypothetical protein
MAGSQKSEAAGWVLLPAGADPDSFVLLK